MIKLSDEELQSIVDVQSSGQRIQTQLGECYIAKSNLKKQILALMAEWEVVRQSFDKIATRLEARYGEGHVNLNDGTFIPKTTNSV